MRRWIFVLLATTLSTILTFAQRGAPPAGPRDSLAAPAVAEAIHRIAGVILAADTTRPLHRALVQLQTGNLATGRFTITGVDGRWAFDAVPAGTYTIVASRDGYVTTSFGQKRPFGAPATVRVAHDEVPGELEIVLPRGGVITGRVTDEFGQPVGGALAQAMRVRYIDGQRQLVEVVAGIQTLLTGGLTDDRGEYRIYGLPPGSYYVQAAYGRIGQGRSDDRSAYATTYYPNTPLVAQAQAVNVTVEQPATADVVLAPTPLVVVSGQVLNESGQPVAAMVTLAPVAPGHAVQAGGNRLSQSSPTGAFTIAGVPTGDYFLQARTNVQSGVEFGMVQVSIAGQDLQDVVVTTVPGGSLSGRLVIDTEARGTLMNAFFIEAVSAEPGSFSGGREPVARVNAGGLFATGGLWGRHLLRLRDAPDGWWLKSVTVDGKDVTDTGIDVSGSIMSNIPVVVTQTMASISGTVSNADGTLLSDYSVVAFSPDESRWTPRSRFMASATPGQDGAFQVTGLPPGDYIVVAVPPLEAGEETDPDRLTRWRSTGRRLTLAAQEVGSVRLTVTAGADERR